MHTFFDRATLFTLCTILFSTHSPVAASHDTPRKARIKAACAALSKATVSEAPHVERFVAGSPSSTSPSMVTKLDAEASSPAVFCAEIYKTGDRLAHEIKLSLALDKHQRNKALIQRYCSLMDELSGKIGTNVQEVFEKRKQALASALTAESYHKAVDNLRDTCRWFGEQLVAAELATKDEAEMALPLLEIWIRKKYRNECLMESLSTTSTIQKLHTLVIDLPPVTQGARTIQLSDALTTALESLKASATPEKARKTVHKLTTVYDAIKTILLARHPDHHAWIDRAIEVTRNAMISSYWLSF
ncbi:MAG: hypothetical protein PVJ92_01035 [Candidatus Dependentiae bacterium]|jgi:hypothetical protein